MATGVGHKLILELNPSSHPFGHQQLPFFKFIVPLMKEEKENDNSDDKDGDHNAELQLTTD